MDDVGRISEASCAGALPLTRCVAEDADAFPPCKGHARLSLQDASVQHGHQGPGRSDRKLQGRTLVEMIGNPQVFAVQLGWRPDPETFKPWMFGVFSVSVCGERLGSPTEEAVLNDILVDLLGWKNGVGKRCVPALMAADPVTAFLSIEGEVYGLEHMADKIPPGFAPVPVPPLNPLEILGVDTLGDYRIHCVEDDATSRLLYARMGELPRECRVPRAVLADVLNRTVERLDGWFQQLPEPPDTPG